MWCSDDLFERNSHVSLSSHLLLRLRLFKLAVLSKIFHTRFIKIDERFSKLAFSLILNGLKSQIWPNPSKSGLDVYCNIWVHQMYVCTLAQWSQSLLSNSHLSSNSYTLTKCLKCLCTLYIKNSNLETNFIWKVMHETKAEWWKNSCRPMIFFGIESPLR